MQHRSDRRDPDRRSLIGAVLFTGGALLAVAGVVLVGVTGSSVWGSASVPMRVGLSLVALLVPGAVLALQRMLRPTFANWRGAVVGSLGSLGGLVGYGAAPLVATSVRPWVVLVGLACYAAGALWTLRLTLRTVRRRWRASSTSPVSEPTLSGGSQVSAGTSSGQPPGARPADGGESTRELRFPLDDDSAEDADRKP